MSRRLSLAFSQGLLKEWEGPVENTMTADSSSVEDLISFADAPMYREKNSKRHRPAQESG